MRYIKKTWHFFFQHEAMRYALSGSIAASIDFLVFTILVRSLHIYYIYANIAAFLIAVSINYKLNRRWTFKNESKRVLTQFLSFAAIGAVGLTINTGLLYIFIEFGSILDLFAKLMATVIVFTWNYLMNKHMTFKRI